MSQEYHIGEALFQPAEHHDSFEKLWEMKWKLPCTMGVYPFMFGCIQDFQPVVDNIIRKGLREPYNWDEYASCFFPKAEELAAIADAAAAAGEQDKAAEYYLRSSAVYRIARFPAPRSEKQRDAWRAGKAVFYKGAALLPFPIREERIPHVHGNAKEGDVIPVNYLVPPAASAEKPAPLVLIFTGLDGYRTDLAVWQRGWLDNGVATMVAEIPGTGDSPADPRDPTSPDRQWSSVLDWLDKRPEIDSTRIVVWGFSTGGYYSLRAGHTHAQRLLGIVSQGGGCHHMFDRDWLERVNKLEYPFDLANTLAYKFGYTDLESFILEAPKFSLLGDGTLDKFRCTNVLLINGEGDEVFPIDDQYVALEHGWPKMSRTVLNRKHMGEPEAFFIIIQWIYQLFGMNADVSEQMRKMPSKMKY
ncbi:Alpha/Beta hydrolase protein [Echria macrotheca]|uniref:Alpha/Beta hydrolase protein n=1 Tax=Echria macrotheca TaxID=438768 RepID=A0AAJ0B700_9PEZI|nr:Alpha/Beta hydrolase protein [Echria macrotheca]